MIAMNTAATAATINPGASPTQSRLMASHKKNPKGGAQSKKAINSLFGFLIGS